MCFEQPKRTEYAFHVYQHVPVQNSSPVIMVSAFHTFSSAMDSQTVWISQMIHLVVEENAKLTSGSVGESLILDFFFSIVDIKISSSKIFKFIQSFIYFTFHKSYRYGTSCLYIIDKNIYRCYKMWHE